MKERIGGLNAIFVFGYPVIGVVLVALGFVNGWFDLLYGLTMGGLFVIPALIASNDKGEDQAMLLSRIFVGSVFVVSGLIKANDPIGFSYKLEEYFAENALNLTFFEPAALAMSVLVSAGEVILGLAVIFGGKARLATILLLVLTLFFAWLTAYTATCDPSDTYMSVVGLDVNGNEILEEKPVACVTDCGCFGDALKGSIGRSLTPWESFKKDIVLLVFVLFMAIKGGAWKLNEAREDKIMLPASLVFIAAFAGGMFGWWFPAIFTAVVFGLYLGVKALNIEKIDKDWQVATMATLATLLFTFYCILYLPQIDFRPFAVGQNITEGMTLPENAKPDVYETTLTYKNLQTGEEQDFTMQEFSDQGIGTKKDVWQFVDSNSELIEKGDEAPIHDFVLTDIEGFEQTDAVLQEPAALVFVSYKIKGFHSAAADEMNALAKAAEADGVPTYWLFSGGDFGQADSVRHAHQFSFPALACDQITLKTIVRSNPGLMLLQEGTIRGKWSARNLPDYQSIKSSYLNQ